MENAERGFNLSGRMEYERLSDGVRKAHTREELAQAVETIKQYVVEHRKDAGGPENEDIRLFLRYCDTLPLRDERIDPDDFLRSFRWLMDDRLI